MDWVEGLEFRILSLGFRVFRVLGLEFGVWGLGFGFGVYG